MPSHHSLSCLKPFKNTKEFRIKLKCIKDPPLSDLCLLVWSHVSELLHFQCWVPVHWTKPVSQNLTWSHISVSLLILSPIPGTPFLYLVPWRTLYLICRLSSDFLSSRISPLTNLSNITHLLKFGLTSLPFLPTAPFSYCSRTIYALFALQEW